MNIAEFSKTSKIPLKTLQFMVKKGVVQEVLTREDLHTLSAIEKLWGLFDFIRPQIKRLNQGKRQSLIQSCGFDSRWERWAYSRMMNVPLNEKMSIKKIINDVEFTFLFKLEPWQVTRIYQVREKAYKDRKALKLAAENPETQQEDNE
jgi:hypothetical protein